MIKAIIFDNIGVFTKKGLGKTLDTFSKRFNLDRIKIEVEYKRLVKSANRGEITANQLYQQIIDLFKLECTVEELRKIHLDSYGEERNDEMCQFAKKLSKDYTICLFTNFSDAFDELNERLRLDEVFDQDKIFVSAKIKLKKPDKEAFEYVLSKIGYKPREVILIDDREDNFEEPTKMGINGILFKNMIQLKKDLEFLLNKKD